MTRSTIVAVATLVCLAATAQAGPITYDFSQSGWAIIGSGRSDSTLTGSFTGTAEPDGIVRLGDLTAFTANFLVAPFYGGNAVETFDLADLSLFAYQTGAFTFVAARASDGARLCTGLAAAAFCGSGGPITGQFTIPLIQVSPTTTFINYDDRTTVAAEVTALAPPPPAVPEPLTLSLFAAGLAGLGGRRARKSVIRRGM